MGADQIQRNLPVNFAAGTAPRDFEIMWVDLTHNPKLFFVRTYLAVLT
jgi:hypothetical protein